MPALNKEQIKKYLLKYDRKLKPVIASVAYPIARKNNDIYATLLNSIVSQQLSVKAAATIHSRLLNLFPKDDPKPKLLLAMSLKKLRSAGLSKQKVGYVRAIATMEKNKSLIYKKLAKKSNEELIDYLTKIHGVGQWTAEILLMFTFNRKDAFPVGDLAIQQAMRHLYGMEEEGKDFKQKLISIAEKWQPYRGIVCKYLWSWKSNGYM